MIVNLVFDFDGNTIEDAKAKADQTGEAVLYCQSDRKYLIYPNDDKFYQFVTKKDILELTRCLMPLDKSS